MEIQTIKFGQLEEYDRVGLLDQPALDLGQVCVGSADSSFDLSEREIAMHAGSAKDTADHWSAISSGKIRHDRRSREC